MLKTRFSATQAVPAAQPRRLRISPAIRAMVRETSLDAADFIYPLFVMHGEKVKNEIHSMPGVYQWSPDLLAAEAESVARSGIQAVLLFGIPDHKDAAGTESYAPEGAVQQAVRVIKRAVPEMVVITDVCLCEYTDHGHCGILNTGAGKRPHPQLPEGYVLNAETLDVLARVAVSHAEAG
ncbi:MAG TPA: porphobilinogen synthase, partial [Anaerolineae bacterium]